MTDYTYVINANGEVVLVKNGYSSYVDYRKEKDEEYSKAVEGVWELKEEES